MYNLSYKHGWVGGSHAAIINVSESTFAYNQAIGGSHATGGGNGQGQVGTGSGGGLLNTGMAAVTKSTFIGNLAQGGSRDGGGSGFIIFGRARAVRSTMRFLSLR